MRVISKARLKQFWEISGHEDAEGPLKAWYTHVSSKTVSWQTYNDVKAAFGNASLVGNCVVFNIGGNKYRLVTRILYASQKVFVLKVMSHQEYDEDKWKEECGCYNPPPKRKAQVSGKLIVGSRRKKAGGKREVGRTLIKPKQRNEKS